MLLATIDSRSNYLMYVYYIYIYIYSCIYLFIFSYIPILHIFSMLFSLNDSNRKPWWSWIAFLPDFAHCCETGIPWEGVWREQAAESQRRLKLLTNSWCFQGVIPVFMPYHLFPRFQDRV